jgi:hypothetical protein
MFLIDLSRVKKSSIPFWNSSAVLWKWEMRFRIQTVIAQHYHLLNFKTLNKWTTLKCRGISVSKSRIMPLSVSTFRENLRDPPTPFEDHQKWHRSRWHQGERDLMPSWFKNNEKLLLPISQTRTNAYNNGVFVRHTQLSCTRTTSKRTG